MTSAFSWQNSISLCPASFLFIIGDWKAKVGSQETPGVTGKFGLGVWNISLTGIQRRPRRLSRWPDYNCGDRAPPRLETVDPGTICLGVELRKLSLPRQTSRPCVFQPVEASLWDGDHCLADTGMAVRRPVFWFSSHCYVHIPFFSPLDSFLFCNLGPRTLTVFASGFNTTRTLWFVYVLRSDLIGLCHSICIF